MARTTQLAWLTATAAIALLAGCSQEPATSSSLDRQLFEEAGPVRVEVDDALLASCRLKPQPYQVRSGDVLELQMPAVVRTTPADAPDSVITMQCRVDAEGKIRLPVVGLLPVTGRTLDEIETSLADAYYPRFVVRRPTVVARVAEYRTSSVQVLGAVRQPGRYDLAHNEMTLVTALLKAGGIDDEGSAAIRIRRAGETAAQSRAVVLPVKGLDVPFADVALAEGDTVEVEPRPLDVFSVVGLVNRPGTYTYPHNADYTLLQAVAMAGGIDRVADPLYATVYRQAEDGSCVHSRFSLTELTSSPNGQVRLKPGDVVALEHTARTQTRVILAHVLRFTTGVNVGAGYTIGGN